MVEKFQDFKASLLQRARNLRYEKKLDLCLELLICTLEPVVSASSGMTKIFDRVMTGDVSYLEKARERLEKRTKGTE